MMARAVVVAHREPMVAEAISTALGNYPGIVPVGATTAAREAERLAGRAHAVAMDPRLPGASAAVDRLRRSGVRVVLIGETNDEDGVRVPTTRSVGDLAAALVPRVDAGGQRPLPSGLTAREAEVLRLVGKGLSGRQVAKQLEISPKTVERHKTRIFKKLGVPNQAAAVFAFRAESEGGAPWNRSAM